MGLISDNCQFCGQFMGINHQCLAKDLNIPMIMTWHCLKCGQPNEAKCKNGCDDVKPPKPTLDLSKPLQTTGGDSARIISTEGPKQWPIVAVIKDKNSDEWVGIFDLDGKHKTGWGSMCLINVPSPAIPFRFERWVNVFKNGVTLHFNRQYADEAGDARNRMACLKIPIEGNEGDGI